MARDKVLKSTRIRRPTRLQDSYGLEETILQDVQVDITNDIDARVTVLEDFIASFVKAQVGTADVELPRRRGGHFTIDGTFELSQIGAPVVIAQGVNPWFADEAEFGIVHFVGQVLTTRSLRVFWNAPNVPPRRVRIHYIIGTLQE